MRIDNVMFVLVSYISGSLLLFNGLIQIVSSTSDRYTGKISLFSTTIPRKVSEEGAFLSHYIPNYFNAQRKKRDLSSEQVYYIIPVDGREHLVHLWPNADFLAPGLVVEKHFLKNNNSRISIRNIRDQQCHYTGVVRGVDRSRVALSTCNGLAGHILIPNDEFFIEPSLDDHREGEYHKHYIYKRESVNSVKNGTNCGTKGTFKKAIKDRLAWEAKYGETIEKSITSDILLQNTSKPFISDRIRREDVGCVTERSTTPCLLLPENCPMRTQHFLEIMITLDANLQKYFFYDLETFILTIMNMVAGNFLDGSVGQSIQIKLVRIVYLTYSLPRLDISRYSPNEILQQFCDWQLELNPLLESHPNHHDFAVFITKFQPCQGSILGLTNMASICRLDKSCTVVSEEGLLLASIITHQIGHSFGAEHDDGDVGGCVGEDLDGTKYHMSPVISLSASAWSVCSKQSFATFIGTRMSWCLVDKPREREFNHPDILPGQVYDAIQQCTLNFKMRTLACSTGDFCKVLYCQISPNKCATTGDPPAPGTPCAKNMWCFHGNCVHRGQRPGSVSGEWGPWTHWTSCTRSCGGGVQSRFRACDNPAPLYGGASCRGSWLSHRMCAIRPCPGYVPSFLDHQCKMTNKRPYRGHYYLWDHFRTLFEDMKCTLVCINELKHISIRSPVVIDGSPCMPGTNNVCINGECRRVGCDFVIESKSKNDMCGRCHGPGTGCKVVQGCFIEPDLEGTADFLKLPEGTSMIYIRELDSSPCYLIITSALNSTYYLNGPDRCENLPGEFYLAGVNAVYDEGYNGERMFSRHPIQAPITISVKCTTKGDMRGFRYQYALPQEDSCYIPNYYWTYLYWDECDRLCGGGVQRARPSCVEKKGGEVEGVYCNVLSRPRDIVRTCNTRPCLAKWWVGAWSNCDCTDGEGVMTRIVFCMKSHTEDYSLSKIVKDKECCYQPKPRVQKPCSSEKDAVLFANQRNRRQVSSEYNYEEFKSHDRHRNSSPEDFEDFSDDYLEDLQETPSESTLDHFTIETSSHSVRRKVKRKYRKHSKIKNNFNVFSESILDPEVVTSLLAEPLSLTTENESANNDNERPDYVDDDLENSPKRRGMKNIRIQVVHAHNTTSKGPTGNNVQEENITLEPSCSMESLCGTTDFFLKRMFMEKEITTCSADENGVEPADLGPRVESQNNSQYKMIIIPVASGPMSLPKTDVALATFGDSLYFAASLGLNQTHISGENIFKLLQEARRRATRPPVVDVDLDQ